ncbi:Retrovirus-related Pol polyprotein from transposon TNT 1-94 [Araneus ventricosus]|uniref:Retrovirus-related Pol polyprotein from transposon TNT 1-94 n=1 Tax=Araneus ventricosus TaxID=182803 RepID=A0A4Y2UC10_ARAVE|nr:Retrovirus-related Pol polyprotein from transposon TNT 1-94 [Araneus ventricosus]
MVSKAKSDPERSRISHSQRSSSREIKFKSGNPKQPSRKKVSQDSVPNRHTSSEVRTSYLLEALFSSEKGGWIFDLAATTNFCRDKDLFSKFKLVNNQTLVGAVDNITTPIKGKGTVHLKIGNVQIKLSNVAYAPELRKNLLSGPCFDKNGASFKGSKGKIDVFHSNNELLFTAKLINGLYYVFPEYPCASKCNVQNSKSANIKNVSFSAENANTWHKRLAHTNVDHIKATSNLNCVKGLPKLKGNIDVCEPCKEAKGKSVSFKPIKKIRSKKPLELIHMDLCGPFPKASIHGHLYFLTIIDDYSRRVFAYPLKTKSDVFHTFSRFQKRAERFLDRKIKCIRTDNGLEFINEQFHNFCDELGIKHERTNIYTPQQNGVSERFNYTAVDGINVLLKDSGLGQGFWSEALLHFVYTWNRICHLNQCKTPFELYGQGSYCIYDSKIQEFLRVFSGVHYRKFRR